MLNKIFNKKLLFEVETIRRSGLFCDDYYGKMYPQVAKDRLIEHYLTHGEKHKRNPNQDFDKQYYVEHYPEVLQYQYHPFVHYILIGRKKNYRTKLESAHILKISQYHEYSPVVFHKQHRPMVSIVVPVYNSWHHNYNCLRYIFNNCGDVSYEVIVADDCSTDETVNIEQYIKNITYVRNERNLGFLGNCNNAAQHARGKYIFFVNSDTLIQPHALILMLQVLQENQHIGICGAKLVMENGRIQIIGGFLRNGKLQRIGEGVAFCDKEYSGKVQKLHFITGAAFMIRRELWEELGGFDKRYTPAYYEDNDLCLQVCEKGYDVVCHYDALVVHLHSISYNKVRNVKKIRHRSRKKFYDKWQGREFTEEVIS